MKITKIVLPDDKDFNDSNSYPHPGFYEVTQFGAPLEGNIYCVPIDKSLFPWSIQKEYIYQIFEYLHNESLNVKAGLLSKSAAHK